MNVFKKDKLPKIHTHISGNLKTGLAKIYRFRSWHAVVLIGLIAITGVAILRFSQASNVSSKEDNQQAYNIVKEWIGVTGLLLADGEPQEAIRLPHTSGKWADEEHHNFVFFFNPKNADNLPHHLRFGTFCFVPFNEKGIKDMRYLQGLNTIDFHLSVDPSYIYSPPLQRDWLETGLQILSSIQNGEVGGDWIDCATVESINKILMDGPPPDRQKIQSSPVDLYLACAVLYPSNPGDLNHCNEQPVKDIFPALSVVAVPMFGKPLLPFDNMTQQRIQVGLNNGVKAGFLSLACEDYADPIGCRQFIIDSCNYFTYFKGCPAKGTPPPPPPPPKDYKSCNPPDDKWCDQGDWEFKGIVQQEPRLGNYQDYGIWKYKGANVYGRKNKALNPVTKVSAGDGYLWRVTGSYSLYEPISTCDKVAVFEICNLGVGGASYNLRKGIFPITPGVSEEKTGVWQNYKYTNFCGVRSIPWLGKPDVDPFFYKIDCPAELFIVKTPYDPHWVDTPSFGLFATGDPIIAATNAPANQQCKILGDFIRGFSCLLGPNDTIGLISNRLLDWHSPSDKKYICITGVPLMVTSPQAPLQVTIITKDNKFIQKKMIWGESGLSKIFACTNGEERPYIDQMKWIFIQAPSDRGVQIKRVTVGGVPINK